MDGGQRSLVTCVHRLQHVDGLGPSNLADHDPVGTHAEGVSDEVSDANRSLSFDVRRPRLERDDVALLKMQLCRVLDRDDPLVARNEARERIEERRLADARAARDQDVELAADAGTKEVDRAF